MKYTKDNIVWLHVYHKDYVRNDLEGNYIIFSDGVDYFDKSEKKIKRAIYNLKSMAGYINTGTWIVKLLHYEIY